MAEIVIVPSAAAAGVLVADEIVKLISARPDAVLVSHCHYDHLDHATLRRLARMGSPPVVTGLGQKPGGACRKQTPSPAMAYL